MTEVRSRKMKDGKWKKSIELKKIKNRNKLLK